MKQLIDALPRYFSQNVITADRRTANIAFGIRTMPLDKQKDLVDDMRAQLDPPRGVDVELAGLPVLAADAHAQLESSRWWLSLAGLVAVFLVLLAAYRRLEAAAVPLIPIALATGWSSLLPVHPADSPEPDVGDTGRARDRDLDRVRGAPVGSLPGRAGGGPGCR